MYNLPFIEAVDPTVLQEEKSIALFNERMNQSRQITTNMIDILETFEERLSKLEKTILPLYKETEIRQLRQRNIESTISVLENVIGNYSVSTEVEEIIRDGPSCSNLDEFINALDKLKRAQLHFEINNPQSVELENVSSLFNSGSDTLNKEFKDMLYKHSKPVQITTLLEWTSPDDVLSTIDDASSVSSYIHFPDNVMSDMIRISNWLFVEERDEYMSVYASVRAKILMQSLNILRDHQRSNSGGSVQGVTASPLLKPKHLSRVVEPSQNRRHKRIQSLLEKKAKGMLLSIESSTRFSWGSRRTMSPFGEIREDVFDIQEIDNYLSTVIAVQKLMQNELSLLSGIIPNQHQHKVFQRIIQEALNVVVQDGDNISNKVKKCINRHDFSTSLVIFPILKHLQPLKNDFEKTIESCEFPVRTQFSNILNTLQSTGSKVLEDFVSHIKSDTYSIPPPDGTVCQLTSDVILFLEQLVDYIDTVGSVLAIDPLYSSLTIDGKLSAFDKHKVLVGKYITKVLSQLNLTLLNKSDLCPEYGLKILFRLNNCQHVLKRLQKGLLLDLASLSEPDCEDTYFKMISNHKTEYLKCWDKLLSSIKLVKDIKIEPYGSRLKDRDKTMLKESFSVFNKEIEDISRLQRAYSVPDSELREGLKRDNKEYILPEYNRFYDLFATVQFSKNMEKYVKYFPADVGAMLDRFFDNTA